MGRTPHRRQWSRCARRGPLLRSDAREAPSTESAERLDWVIAQLRLDPPDPDQLARDIMATLTARGLIGVDPGRVAHD
jgi:hypothetical protein